MTATPSAEWLLSTVSGVRERMVKQLGSLDPDAKRELETALQELDVMWGELQGEAALLVREIARYAEFFEYSPDACVITDLGGNAREANQAALELFAAARDELVGRPLSDYIAEEDRAGFLRLVGLMPGGKPLSWPAHVRTADGRPLAVELSARAIALKRSGAGGLCWLMRPAA